MHPPSFNRVTIDAGALVGNFSHLRNISNAGDFLAMVKADGYGHGMIWCATALQKSGCRIFGVAELPEAVTLRQSGISGEIFSMIGFDGEHAEAFLDYSITPVVYDAESVEALGQAALKRNRVVEVHLKVDTGMSRLGVGKDGIDGLLKSFEAYPLLKLKGVASHFPCADDPSSPSTKSCLENFGYFREKLEKFPGIRWHIANSGGTLFFPDSHHDMVRCGISLYGYSPDGGKNGGEEGLKPVMSFSTRVIQVKEVEAGTGISYGHTYITTRKTTLAVLPVGYEDGFSRQLSNCGEVLIRGRRAPVLGRVCMNLCMVDVTDIGGVSRGDEAVILGSQGDESITADDIADKIGSISYEVLCMIGNNNQRTLI